LEFKMNDRIYECVTDEDAPNDAVTVSIFETENGVRANVMWTAAEAPEDVPSFDLLLPSDAFVQAEEVARRRGFKRVVVFIANQSLWSRAWGTLVNPLPTKEPIGDIRGTGLDEAEALSLASDIEHERDA
jgi:hypothetical protein